MGTNSPELATHLMDAIDRINTPYALLHEEANVATGQVHTDIDVVVDEDPRRLLRAMMDDITPRHASPLLLWNYDTGCWTSFWFTADLSQGVQLDLMCDPDGESTYGIRTSAMLEHRVRGRRYWHIDQAAANLYEISKRLHKRDRPRLEAATASFRSNPDWDSLCRELLSRRRLEELSPVLADARPGRATREWPRRPGRSRSARRLLDRLTHPIGLIVNTGDHLVDESAQELASRLSGILPSCHAQDVIHPWQLGRLHLRLRQPSATLTKVPGRWGLLLGRSRVIDLSSVRRERLGHELYDRARQILEVDLARGAQLQAQRNP